MHHSESKMLLQKENQELRQQRDELLEIGKKILSKLDSENLAVTSLDADQLRQAIERCKP